MSENHQNQITELPYSYHTFLLAFHFDGTFDDRRTGNWKHYSMRDDSYEEVKYKYQIYQYFNTDARKLMFDDESNPRFVYDIPEHLSREYVITKGAETYTLHIDNIKAFVSKHNIAIIQFDLENHEADPDRRNLSYVNRINEYGRRINLPFVVDEGAFHPLVADSVTILGHRVIFLSMTNGNAGHMTMTPEELRSTRMQEMKVAAQRFGGIRYETMDINDGYLTADSCPFLR